ncbi:hypothetical protein H109_03448 [Trichophyton interdigitale MR816]|uniref:Uncharacterized protein n=1 Tax=Trichophyton interdigitale (strain MR816) TaxID=1215338 RepID=A0A059JA58_TRIIM|nr:hypothetical protein H109_03448 [Trichophyton interdigitale MR816]
MHNHHHHHNLHHRPREPQGGDVPVPAIIVRSAPIPNHRIPLLTRVEEPAVAEPMARPLERRDTPDTTRLVPRRDATCSPDNNAGKDCGPGLTETPTVAIALGVVIPLVCAFIVFFLLHRRHVKKLRKEDEQDKIKALDYGLDDVPASNNGAKVRTGGGQGVEKNADGHKPSMSMDWAMDSPYFLPPGLQKSRGSLHSLSRTIPGEDKYGIAFDGNGSIRSNTPTRRHNNADDASSYTAGSSGRVGGADGQHHHNGGLGDDMSQNLLRNAQRMSTSPPLAAAPAESPSPPQPAHLPFDNRFDELGLPSSISNNYNNNNNHKEITNYDNNNCGTSSNTGDDNQMGAAGSKDPALRSSHNYLGQFIHSGSKSSTPDDQKKQDSASNQQDGHPSLPGLAFSTNDGPKLDFNLEPSSTPAATAVTGRQQGDADSDYGDESKPSSGLPQFNIMPAEEQQQQQQQLHGDEYGHGYPEEGDDGTDSIHDVYDQYYDSNHLIDTRRLTMGIRPLPPEDPSDNPEQRANRIRSFYKEYFDESKPFQQDYIEDYGDVPPLPNPTPPFAQPLPRRAMTPPPRMPPAFPPRRHPGVGHQPPPGMGGMNRGFAHSATNSLASGGHPMDGPRAFSSASGRIPHPRQKKPLPPPSPLHILPTPHKLKDDTFLPIDFAPGPRARDRQAGQPETPLGGLQHYNLMVPSHSPLVSSFDELPSVPSPHALRKSGTYTALDFAPPPRFKNESGTGSDAGSIRSNRTGISALQAHNIRSGAYRVSRLPAETVGTRDDFSSNLKPQWEMRT